MNTKTVTDGQLGQLAVKQNELFLRAKKGVYESFDEMLNAIQQVIEGKAPTIPTLATPIIAIFRLTVDYSQPLEAMIAAGQYDWKNSDITAKRFPITEKGTEEFEACYFHFNRDISSENAIKEIEAADTANPWSPAKIEHVLSHGKTYPEEQRKFPIIGLGSVAEFTDDCHVPYLSRDGSKRRLFLGWFGRGWGSGYRFLAVRKISVA